MVNLVVKNQLNSVSDTSKFHFILCETFYSLQGEGACLGYPAVFLRLAGCNLRCNGFTYRHPETGEHLGCDTKHVWLQGQKQNFQEVIAQWRHEHYLQKMEQGAHLIITGGEPLIQQDAILNFIKLLDRTLAKNVFIELETNATLLPVPALLARLDQINTSPKLKHSGEPKDKAYHPAILKTYADLEKVKFKFVVATPSDIDEIIVDYLEPFKINPRRVWLMPEGGTRSAIQSKQQWIAEKCKEYLFNYTPRLHIDLWNEATGV